MIDKDKQKLLWASLSKEERKEYSHACDFHGKGIHPFNLGYCEALRQIFGHHNLTSDTEPSECICISKEKFDNFYKLLEHCYNHDSILYDDLYWKFVECLPDKEPMKIDAADSLIAMAKDEMGIAKEPVKVGDKVRTIKDGLIWHVAGFADEYVILGGENGCIKEFSDFIQYDKSYKSYRFAKPKCIIHCTET